MTWEAVDYKSTDLPAGARAYVAALDGEYSNGSAVARLFEATDASAFDRVVKADSIDRMPDAFFDWLEIKSPLGKHLSRPMFERISVVKCETLLAQTLVVGGLYSPGFESVEATRLSRGCMEALFGEGLEAAICFCAFNEWSDWFNGVCDMSVFILDLHGRRWWCLFATDFD